MIFLAPIILPAFGNDGPIVLFTIASVMFAVSVLCAYLMPPIPGDHKEAGAHMPTLRELRDAAGQYMSTIRTLAKDPVATLALIHYATGSSLVLLFAVLVPRYMQTVLEVSPDKAVTIFAPVGIGAVVGLRAVPFIVSRIGKNRTVIVGLTGLAFCVLLLALVEPIAELLESTENLNPFSDEQRAAGLSILVLLTAAFAGPLGFTYALVNAPAQTVLHERAPAEMRGRVFAAQVVLANAAGIIPLVVAGSVADIFGVSVVLFTIALSLATIAGVSVYLEARWSAGSRPPPAVPTPIVRV
jgi:MFS family permease